MVSIGAAQVSESKRLKKADLDVNTCSDKDILYLFAHLVTNIIASDY